MDEAKQRMIEAIRGALNGSVGLEAALASAHPEVLVDWSRSHSPYRSVARGREHAARFIANVRESWSEVEWTYEPAQELDDGSVVMETTLRGVGAQSGVAVLGRGAQLITFRDGLIGSATVFQSIEDALAFVDRLERIERLRNARLYFVCDGMPNGADPEPLLEAAIEGGVDVIQLREKAPRCAEELLAFAEPFARVARGSGTLFFLNDEPGLVAQAGADGVHVGQDDATVLDARKAAGVGALVGLSTHSANQLDAALAAENDARPDEISVGPVWETPTKAGRPAAGLSYVEHAAARAGDAPWFAIGGIDLANVRDVTAAGAARIVVVRAIRDAPHPREAAAALRAALDTRET